MFVLKFYNFLTDIYSDTLDEASVVVQNMFQRLRDIIRREARLQQDMNKLMGSMETILAASNVTNNSHLQTKELTNEINAVS